MGDELTPDHAGMPAQAPSTPVFVPAGLGRRFLAFAADMLFLGVVGFTIAVMFYDPLVRIGPYGRILGFGVLLVYLGLLNSRIAAGRTLGKILLGTRVMGREGQPIGLRRSFFRASLVAIPYMLNGWALPVFQRNMIAAWLAGVVVMGLGGTILYTMIFNRSSRQGLHDLACGTYVERVSTPATLPIPRVRRLHLVMSAVIVAVSMALPLAGLVFTRMLGVDLTPMRQLHEALSKDPRFFGVGVNHLVVLGERSGRQVLTVQGWYVGVPTPDQRHSSVDALARVCLSEYPMIGDVTDMVIIISSAFDLGIASWTNSFRDMRTLEEWRRKLAPPPMARSDPQGARWRAPAACVAGRGIAAGRSRAAFRRLI